jgi:hypothetical protein
LREHPDRIFLDAACTQKLPIDLPPLESRCVHGIAVALGAQKACSAYLGDPDGSLIIVSALKGMAHSDPSAAAYHPFAFGDVDPDGPFVHVFDETALETVMRELDTVSDFVRYLVERETAIRGGQIFHAASEADLLSTYLQSQDETGAHVFPQPADLGFASEYETIIASGMYQEFASRPDYQARKAADKVAEPLKLRGTAAARPLARLRQRRRGAPGKKKTPPGEGGASPRHEHDGRRRPG